MAPTPTQKKFIEDLENNGLFCGRYDKLTCVNGHIPQRRGVLSLVFQAHDAITDDLVAIKFMDPELLSDKYRISAFEREPEILAALEGKKRCLQITSSLDYYKWEVVKDKDGNPIHIPCGYFATEWLEEDVDDFFHRQREFSAKQKLVIFRSILLCIEAIHSENIFHRDVKINNLRLKVIGDENIVIAIDFGTAAEILSPNIKSYYGAPVGAPAFSGPETYAGFTGVREYAHLTDAYAAGALLFELFNSRQFSYERQFNTCFDQVTLAISSDLNAFSTAEDKYNEWCKRKIYFKHKNVTPDIEGDKNTIPANISLQLKKLYSDLINYDFTSRISNLREARIKVDSMLKVIDNEMLYQKRLEYKRMRKIKKQEKAIRKEERLNYYLNMRDKDNATS